MSAAENKITSPHSKLDPLTGEEILQRARQAAPILAARAEEIEQARRLPDDVVALLRSTGVFRMAFPSTWGRPVTTAVEQTQVIEALAVGDASAAWCAMGGMGSGLVAHYVDEKAAHELLPTPDTIVAGAIPPKGRAERVPGGYRVTGTWQFGSGITHCDRVIAGCLVFDDGRPERNPDPRGGRAHWRIIVGRPEQFDIKDTWHVTGLAGSGSLDYSAKDLFVPESHTFSFANPVLRGPETAPDAILRTIPGVALGVGRAALLYIREMAATRVDRSSRKPWREDYRVQTAVAQAEMELLAARHAVYGTLQRQWEILSRGEELDPDDLVSAALARFHAFRSIRNMVGRLFDVATTAAVFRPSPLDRYLRDLNAMCQHVTAQDQILQSSGAVLLGGTPKNAFAVGLPE
jgi:indole-3-acetate monooxygenase